jgi:hypothetical protein
MAKIGKWSIMIGPYLREITQTVLPLTAFQNCGTLKTVKRAADQAHKWELGGRDIYRSAVTTVHKWKFIGPMVLAQNHRLL